MMNTLVLVIVLKLAPWLVGGVGAPARHAAGDATGTGGPASVEIAAVLQRYVRAVDDADTTLLRGFGDLDGDTASYVHPTRRLRTWAEVTGFWQGFLGNGFSARQFTPDNVTIRRLGNVAWVVFNWDFKATRINGQAYQSRGWETQVYRKTPSGWRITHAHYSAAPTPGQ